MRFSQFGNKLRALGTYELQEDAARAYDKVARILGRLETLNFPNSDALEISGSRSKDADKAVAAGVEAARTFMAAGGNKQTSVYIGVCNRQKYVKKNPLKNPPKNPWASQVEVSSQNVGGIRSAHTPTCTRTPMHAHTQFNQKQWNLGQYAVEEDAAAARDIVAKVLGHPLNFKKPRKITGRKSKGSEGRLADAVKAANALMLSI